MENDKAVLASHRFTLASHRFTLGYHRIGMQTNANFPSYSLGRSQQCRASETASSDHGKHFP